MRKTYSKPDIVFESFSLCSNIAAGCEKIVNFASGTCGVIELTPGITIFSYDMAGCTPDFQTDEYDGWCYHNPSENNNMFNS